MIERYFFQIETTRTGGFSHPQIDQQVEFLNNVAVIQFPSLEIFIYKSDQGPLVKIGMADEKAIL
jgi:hypothetical protein